AAAQFQFFDTRRGQRLIWPDDYQIRDSNAVIARHPQFPNLLIQVSRGTGEFTPAQELKLFIAPTRSRSNRVSLFRSIPIPVVARFSGDRGWRLFRFLMAVNESDEAVPEGWLTFARIHPSIENWVRSFWPEGAMRVSLYDLSEQEIVWARRHAVILPF